MTVGNQQKPQTDTIAKEFFFGLIAILLGAYNIASYLGYLPQSKIPQMIGDGVLIVVGLILWLTAYKLWRYRWHTRRLF